MDLCPRLDLGRCVCGDLVGAMQVGDLVVVEAGEVVPGDGDIVGIVEGAEATAPFDFPIPIDAITVAIFDSLSYEPPLSDS